MEIVNDLGCELTQEGIIEHVGAQIKQLLPQWRERVAQQPRAFGEIEEEILGFGRKMAGLLTAAVLQHEAVQEGVSQEAEQIREEAPGSLRKVYQKPRSVQLLCGLVLNVVCWYCAPQGNPRRRKGHGVESRCQGREVGLYPELAALGIREGASPQLQSEVGRMVGLLPSFEIAQQELAHRGAALDYKKVRRLAEELGVEALSHRRQEIECWRRGEMEVGQELVGKRVVVAIDGGRARTRKNRKGRKSGKGRHRFQTPWREPKLIVIYIVDEEGQIDRSQPLWIDGTLQGPDHLMELVAYHLHRLGALYAREVVFIGDGAEWIWDRVPRVIERVGLKEGQWFAVADVYHAVEHLAEALKAARCGSAAQRKKILKALKRKLLQGRLDEVIGYLQGLSGGRGAKTVRKALGYFERRRSLMRYALLKQRRLPVGSGAIESAIRRVVNLRLKGPTIFWYEENLEAVMYLRAQALTGRWDEMMANVYRCTRLTRKLAWRWKPTPMVDKKTNKSQLLVKQKGQTRAA